MPTTATDPAARARHLAAALLVPVAERTDIEGVRRAVLDEIGAAGLLGLTGPRGYGGGDAPAEDLRRAAYALLHHVPADEQVEDRLAPRAATLELAVRAATSLVAASGGSAMSLSAPPQRLLREALFHLVTAQTAPVREATLHRLLEQTA